MDYCVTKLFCHNLQQIYKWSNSWNMYYFIYISHHFTPHKRYELNKLTSLPMCGFIAQLVEHCASITEVTGSNSVEARIFFRFLLSNCLNWKIYCDDHSSLSSTIAVQIWIISYILHITNLIVITTNNSYNNLGMAQLGTSRVKGGGGGMF